MVGVGAKKRPISKYRPMYDFPSGGGGPSAFQLAGLLLCGFLFILYRRTRSPAVRFGAELKRFKIFHVLHNAFIIRGIILNFIVATTKQLREEATLRRGSLFAMSK